MRSSSVQTSGAAGAMKRQKPGRSTADLPAAIGALSLALPGARVSPETFRLAKFDRPEASIIFWKLLYSLLTQIQGGEWKESADTGSQVRFVKSVAFSHGYRRLAFYDLPCDGSAGSRELLLVFSWFLCRINLMEQLLMLNRVKPWDEVTVCTCDTTLKSWKEEKDLAPESHSKGQRDVRYLQWLNGRLQFQWRSWHTDQQEQCKLWHKVHSYTIGSHANPTTGHFSVTETDAVRHPDSCMQMLQLMESESSRLEAFLKWKPLELVYWHWMESVLGPEAEETRHHNERHKCIISPSSGVTCYSVDRIAEEIGRCKKDLLALGDMVRELVRCRKLSCQGKVEARKQELGEKEFCRTVQRAQETVRRKLSDLRGQSSPCGVDEVHGPYRLVFTGKCSRTIKTGFARPEPKKTVVEGVTATSVISELRKRKIRLTAELKQRQEVCRRKVGKAIEGLGQVLLIAPMKR
ncbi:tubulin epsilon and delta complex protein 1 [Eublepharis macularius]|uniref:Tubulin epsilon and delta complex protein 1 n=1 Tax=Eublepharis macularius TaxID=481883 RepID=A0AA97JF45_EUBMA|nr:tubulin epsilon and delta complex protein 1 [Eublepharis macularius]